MNIYYYICSKCNITLPREAFHRDRTTTKGHSSICKSCKSKNRDIAGEMIRNTRSRAKKKGLEFNLSKKFIEDLNIAQNGKCVYSGTKLNWEPGNRRGRQRVCPPDRASIDRIDSDKGYTKDNVQLVCDFVNRIKCWYPEKDVYRFCKQVVIHFEEQEGRKV